MDGSDNKDAVQVRLRVIAIPGSVLVAAIIVGLLAQNQNVQDGCWVVAAVQAILLGLWSWRWYVTRGS